MASSVEICNRALQKLGAKRITSLNDSSVNARACLAAYETLRDSELQDHPWSFAITREEIAADATEPAFGRAYAYSLPALCLRVLPPYPEYNFMERDWIVEGRKIMTNESAPLQLRYVAQIEDCNLMHPLFREALATRMALELCEEITQSNTKKQLLSEEYKDIVRRARKASAIESVPIVPPEDSWITGRS